MVDSLAFVLEALTFLPRLGVKEGHLSPKVASRCIFENLQVFS